MMRLERAVVMRCPRRSDLYLDPRHAYRLYI
jgi:hypothetical protein